MIQKIVWERFYDAEGGDNDVRVAHFKKYEVGTIIGIYDFLSDPDYYTKMYTIVHKSQKYVTNV